MELENLSLETYTTEQRNEASGDIDAKNSLEIVTIINREDVKVAPAVGRILPEIAALVDDVVAAFRQGGRLIYIGAGTSGRLGVLDASECPPTYGVSPEMVRGLIAGGQEALTRSVESAEDRAEEGVADLRALDFCARDVLLGITASGQAPYVLGALEYARSLGAVTGAISCNGNSKTFDLAMLLCAIVKSSKKSLMRERSLLRSLAAFPLNNFFSIPRRKKSDGARLGP
jgi:N-acetylmuramic acid 6-phosphate etherase